MSYKPRTSAELNQFHIERGLLKLKRKQITVQECDLNRRFDRLKRDNVGMWEELYPKYVEIVRKKALIS